jgi:predicted SprT family Zn-dependent metalloprotease
MTKTKTETTITEREYSTMQRAYEYFNAELFEDSLPHVLITYQRHAKAEGYFSFERFTARGEGGKAHELAMNPDVFSVREDRAILDTLVHEMAHVWQFEHGKPSRSGYHNKEWAKKMREIGLQPSDTGKIGGKETGQRMSDYIIPGGRFDVAFQKLAKSGFKLSWQSHPAGRKERKAKAASKTKYTCPDCDRNAWAKPGSLLICGECFAEDPEPTLMVAAS